MSDYGYRKFRIVRQRYFDETATQKREHWIIQEWRKFGIFTERWRPLTHIQCYGADVQNVVTEFRSMEKARDVVKVLRNGGPIDKWVSEVVESDE